MVVFVFPVEYLQFMDLFASKGIEWYRIIAIGIVPIAKSFTKSEFVTSLHPSIARCAFVSWRWSVY